MFENSKSPAMSYIESFSHSGKPVSDLSRIKRLLGALGDPQDQLRFIHIAGTNGKGSAAQMFAECLMAQGYVTGLFTSPYILEYSDRIRVQGENIKAEDLEEHTRTVKAGVEDLGEEGFSQFEITQCIAFLHFVKCGCDIVVLETGLGVLLDCTNAVTTTQLSVITSVDLDHTAILGDTIREIAAQKAGIIKEGVPVVLSAANPMEAVRVVRDKAAQCRSQLVIPDLRNLQLYECTVFGSSFDYKGRRYSVSMGGAHQVLNAMTVIAGLSLIRERLPVSYENVAKGLERAAIHGRVEVLSREPLTILDGAHNPDGMRALAGVLKHCEVMPVRAVIGMCKDKNISDAVKSLIPYVEKFVTVEGFCDRAEDKDTLASFINDAGGNAAAGEDIMEEIRKLRGENPKGMTLICGSLFLVSYVLGEEDLS